MIEESGWVIVRDLPGQLGYYDGVKFSTDNLAAIRFCRREDAERMLRCLHGGSPHPDRVEEHLWTGAFNLGDRLKDRISGVTGIVTARVEFLNKCVRYGLSPEKPDKDGKTREAQYFDEEQLVLVKPAVIKVEKQHQTGGPQPAPQRASDPHR